jgi:hypothetical protein
MRDGHPVIVLILAAVLAAAPACAEPVADTQRDNGTPTAGGRPPVDAICRTIEQAAADNELPVEFFTRLIWQESRFDPHAVSPAGAQGIAQFMPRTATWRGLANPFEPLEALRESAAYLRELRRTFGGNLGLAAAAYNAGPGRLEGWRAGRGYLPAETRAYVAIVTGHSIDDWAGPEPPEWKGAAIPAGVPCTQLVNLLRAPQGPRPRIDQNPAWGPWGVQLAGNWSQGRVLASYEQLRRRYAAVLGERLPLVLRSRGPGRRAAIKHIVRVAENSRQGAERLCDRLRAAGAACIVLRNPRV